jgi:molecular chaperone DnaK
MPELQQALFTVGSNMYQQAGGTAPEGEAPNGATGDTGSASSGAADDVIDADFTESK